MDYILYFMIYSVNIIHYTLMILSFFYVAQIAKVFLLLNLLIQKEHLFHANVIKINF